MIPWLSDIDPFPPLHRALGPGTDAPGLLAASAELTAERLEDAYRHGIFPWYSDGQPVLWWSPDPRMTLDPAQLHVSASLRKTLRKVLRDDRWEIRVDHDFAAVMRTCAGIERVAQNGTWITEDIVDAYSILHARGFAHSVETWFDGARVGGLYGVAIGRMCFGESMFADRPDASKIALAALCSYTLAHGVQMIDCQQNTAHLQRMGGTEMPRAQFIAHLRKASAEAAMPWQFDKQVLQRWAHPVAAQSDAINS